MRVVKDGNFDRLNSSLLSSVPALSITNCTNSDPLLTEAIDSATLQLISLNGNLAGDIAQLEYGEDSTAPVLCQLSVTGTQETPIARGGLSRIGEIAWASYDGVASDRASSIRGSTTNAWSDSDHSSAITFQTTHVLDKSTRLMIWEDRVKVADLDDSPPNASALLELSSVEKALLLTRLSTGEMNAIASPINGMLIYNTDTNSFYGYAGGVWKELAFSP